MRTVIFCATLILAFTPASRAQSATFSKSKYPSVEQPEETDVELFITDSIISIKSKAPTKINPAVDIEIPISSIKAMSYERASKHRMEEGTVTMLISPLSGAIVMATKTATHWLQIEYHEAGASQFTELQLDKSEYKAIISALEAKTGKQVAILKPGTSSLDRTAASKDMDEVIPFPVDKVMSALKPAMEGNGCMVRKAVNTRVECRRLRRHSGQTDSGGENVLATLETEGGQTRVQISTGNGPDGKPAKKNWSTPIFQRMMKRLQDSQPSA